MDRILYFMTAFPFELPSAQLDYGKRFSVSRSASNLPWRLSCCLADQVASTAARPHRRWWGRSVTVRRGDTFSGLPHVSTSPGSAVRMPVRLLKPHLCGRVLYLLSTQIAPLLPGNRNEGVFCIQKPTMQIGWGPMGACLMVSRPSRSSLCSRFLPWSSLSRVAP